ncbi:AMP-binding protein [Cognatishimia sp. MH4019]|uniref:AMP-binding protein n=1 Tax=Cognatishimia sp. MH4019 TaxID=2854030 RepID=UPI001CD61F84|nr:AMP-binding protein [Cognatishimia sp. MH4019]
MADLVNAFRDAVAARGDAVALIEGDGRPVSFADLLARAEGFAADLQRRGVRKGDRALVAMPVGADLYAALAGLWMVGAVAVFPEPALGLKGLRHAVRVTRPKLMVATGAYRFLRLLPGLWRAKGLRPGGVGAPEAVAFERDDPALMSFTSGSTGVPKCIMRSHGFLMGQRAAVAPLLEAEGARDLVAFPVFVLVGLAAGRCSVLPNWKLSKQGDVTGTDLVNWINHSGATRALLPPALCERLGEVGVPEAVTDVFTGGGPVFPDVMRALAAQCRVTAVYGSTEAEPIAEISALDIAEADWAAMAAGDGLLVGKPVPVVELRLEDDEIWVAGAHVNEGYLDPVDDAANKVNEGGRIWHRTGDAGRLDATGRLWLLGRHSARVTWQDGWLYPFQVEVAARLWGGVRRAALVEIAGASVLAIEADALRDWPVPEGLDIRVVDAIPMDARHGSKVDLAALKAMLE